MTVLRAGPVEVLLDCIDLRYARLGDIELIRRIYVAVRDADWNTIPASVEDLDLHDRGDRFELSFTARHVAEEADFVWAGRICGADDGTISYEMNGRTRSDLRFNRIGICIHYPWREVAGSTFCARTPDGVVRDVMPTAIAPQRLEGGVYVPMLPACTALELDIPGYPITCEFTGELWEVEDHRNWTDASFKAYPTPIGLPIPHVLRSGEALSQSVRVLPRATSTAARRGSRATLAVATEPIALLPAIGIGADRDDHQLTDLEADLLKRLGPDHLRVDVRLHSEHWQQTVSTARRNADRIGANLELALHVRPDHENAIGLLADLVRGAPAVDRVLVFSADGRIGTELETTPRELVDHVRDRLGELSAPVVGGTEMYFAELNRTRPAAQSWDGVCFSVCPQVHAFTDLDLIENLDAQGEVVRSLKAFAPGKPVIVSPVTLRRRFNFHAAVIDPPTRAGELPDSVDPRQASKLGAAWTVGSIKYLAEAGAASITFFESTGPRGLLERERGPALPQFPVIGPGGVYPLCSALAQVMSWRGADVLPVTSTKPLDVIGFALRRENRRRVFVTSLLAETQTVTVCGRDLRLDPYELAILELD